MKKNSNKFVAVNVKLLASHLLYELRAKKMLAIKTYCQPQAYYQLSGKKTICIFSKDA